MGAQGSRSEGILQSDKPNGKRLEILVELCASWSFDSVKANVEKTLFAKLNKLGYEIKFIFEPLTGGNGEFFIYETSFIGKKLVFSNNKSICEKQTVFGRNLNKNNLQSVIDLLIEF